jgi:hypothetical protein
MSTTALSRGDMHRTFLAIERHGGNFCAALANAWYKADAGNKARIEAAFPDLLERYGPDSNFFYLQNQ